MKSTILILSVLWPNLCFAQEHQPMLNPASGQSMLFSLVPRYPSVVSNPLDRSSGSVFSLAHERRLPVPELASHQFYLTMPRAHSRYAMLYNRFGYAVSHFDNLQFQASRELDENWGLGISLTITNWRAGDQKRHTDANPGLTSFIRLSDAICLGTLIQYSRGFNMTLGGRMALSDRTTGFLEMDHTENGLHWTSGLSYALDSSVGLVLGYRSMPARPSIGSSFTWERLMFSLCFELHPRLGLRTSAGLAFIINEEGQ